MQADTLNRPMRDLRISVTDRCSFRCTYCMPREIYDDHEYLARSEILTYGEIARFARIAAEFGVAKIRLTGGEPLLRREIEKLVQELSDIDGIGDLAMTTNGQLLGKQANALADAGLDRVTVSLDGIDDKVVRAMIDTDVSVDTILDAIDVASDAGLGPIKINTVVRRGWNESQIIPLIEHFRGTGHTVRFIEYMDVGTTNSWKSDEVVRSADLLTQIAQKWPIVAVGQAYRGEVASRYRFEDGQGEIGFISSVSEPFCGDCSRLRLAADGTVYTCLFASSGTDFKLPMRTGASDDDLAEILLGVWAARDDRYSELRGAAPLDFPRVEMSYIGG
ncbi:MAG: GTP 3',8-cyclase MoaA [Actinomycetia bacterium]|nr:GTP 3',8-cyclase MoaA [Actinomycetes bacterium]